VVNKNLRKDRKMNENTCYFYHRGSRYNATVAWRRNEDGSIAYGAAFCRPSDSFVKSLGRKIAQGRLNLAVASCPAAPASRRDVYEEIIRNIEVGLYGYEPTCFKAE
tara:strand:+ start:521 stop:841 length:321 start_codon:yes stop_codon:yes gene_type:complete